VNLPAVPSNLERAAGWSWRLLVCAVAVIGALAVLRYLRVIVLPIMVALTIAPALAPISSRLRQTRFARAAAAVALVTGIAVVVGLGAIVTTSVLAQWDDLVDSVSQAVDDITERLEEEPFNLSLDRSADFRSSLGESWEQASGYAASGVQAGVGLLTGLVLAIAVLYFVLRDGRELWAWILRRFAAENRPTIDRAGARAWHVLGGFVRGTALIAAIDATLIGFGLWLLGVPLAFALAVLVFMGGFVPFVGAFVTGLVAVLVAFADGGWEMGLAALGIVLAVQFIEGNFLQPIIQSRTVDLHPALILLAVAAGASLFGVPGAYLAVPVTAVVFAVIASLESDPQPPVQSRD
jgi:predicted PurR-regulated permease PerM